ncbi:MAG: GLUG motif-containing protein, partial [Planctomycetota bacterium]
SSDTVNAIRWMVPQAALLVGTTGGEWKLSPSAVDDFLSANNPPRTRKQSSYGSAQIQALAMNNQTIFAQRQAQKVRKLEYSFEQDNWIAEDLTLLAEHITGDGITSMALQKNPYPVLWCVRDDGTLATLTLEDSHEVVGWSRQVTGQNATITAASVSIGAYPTLQAADDQADPGLAHDVAISSFEDLVTYFQEPFVSSISITEDATFSPSQIKVTFDNPIDVIYTFGLKIFRLENSATYENGLQTLIKEYDSATYTFSQNYTEDESNVAIMWRHDIQADNQHYYLTADIDASDTAGSSYLNGYGWFPSTTIASTTTLDGCGYTISGLTQSSDRTLGYSQSDTSVPGGFLIWTSGGTIANLTLADVNLYMETGGTFIDYAHAASTDLYFYNCHAEGDIRVFGDEVTTIGGFAGVIQGASPVDVYIYDCTADVNIIVSNGHTTAAPDYFGGFAGTILGRAHVRNCSASGDVTVNGYETTNAINIGGFAGLFSSSASDIRDCSATGDVEGDKYVGGFVGQNYGSGTIARCSAVGDVNANDADNGRAGGFLGSLGVSGNPAMTDCYAWGDVTGGSNSYAGGFLGYLGAATRCYSIGAPTGGDGKVGGFSGYGGGVLYHFWDTETSGLETAGTSCWATGHTTSWMQTQTNYTDATWDFDDVWEMTSSVATRGDANFISVAVIPGSNEDEVWVAVERYIDSTDVVYVEQFQPVDWGADQNDAFFVDSGLTGSSISEATGLDHLEGEVIAAVGNGAYLGEYGVNSGGVSLGTTYTTVHTGIPYAAKLQPMKLEVVGKPGALFGEIKRITHLFMRFYETVGCDAGPSFTDYDPMIFNNDPNNAVVYSGDIDFEFDGDNDREGDICLAEDEPYPLT